MTQFYNSEHLTEDENRALTRAQRAFSQAHDRATRERMLADGRISPDTFTPYRPIGTGLRLRPLLWAHEARTAEEPLNQFE